MKHIVVIPVFNDWKSLNKLLTKLNFFLKNKKKITNEVLIVNDNSSEEIQLDYKRYESFKNIKILSLRKNVGSQIAIAIGLNYLNSLKNEFYVTVMDADGEDSPAQVNIMLECAINNKNFVVTSNRKKRKESLLIILLYKLHLLLTFLFTAKWISFGNFSTFHKKNLKKLLSNKCSLYAHSSSILKNCNIKRLYAVREKRFYDKSKISILGLIYHSLRVNSVFYKNIFFSSVVYTSIIYIFFEPILLFPILFYNLIILYTKYKFWNFKMIFLKDFIGNTKLFRTN
ncbi:MAG: glycosyltransferase family 2 protein [Pelagibacteraceae bacterium]|nr:glycosyltransferase family 2 protein [Pelagibacteraceae bacterium]